MLDDQQLAEMEREGFVTLDTPFTPDEIAAAADAADDTFGDKPQGFIGTGVFAAPLLHLMFHPVVEAAACRMLRTDALVLRGMALRKSAPQPDAEPGLEREHADIRYSAADLDATPRRMLCTILIWLTDVTSRRAPLMYRPGSHRQLADAFTGPPRTDAFTLDRLPELPYAEPVPLLARAGQISVGTTGVLHSGSVNTDTRDRKVIFTQWQARDVPPVTFNEGAEADTRRYFAELAPHLPPDRRALLGLAGQTRQP